MYTVLQANGAECRFLPEPDLLPLLISKEFIALQAQFM